jgi:hypothetical protein
MNSSSLVALIGFTREPHGGDQIAFALDVDRDTWIDIPASIVDSVDELGEAEHCGESLHRVRLTLKPAETPEARVLAGVAVSYEHTLKTLAIKVSSAISEVTTEASPACLACVQACALIVVTESDPFAQIYCMLACACP